MSSAPIPTAAPTTGDDKLTLEDAIERARRAFALKQYEKAVDFYATALEMQTAKYGENASENADLYFAYGKALLENAITQSSVLGKNQTEGAINNDEPAASSSGAFLSFSGDAEDEDDEDEVKEDTTESKPAAKNGDDDAVDLFAEASRAVEAEEAAAAENDEDYEDEPEDDFNAAWEVLDLARALYDKQKDTDNEIKLKLADTYICLGDISLETEKFESAISDYENGLALKTELLPLSSRQLAEVHYKLGLVLDITPGRLSDAIVHVRRALESTDARLDELRVGLNPPEQTNSSSSDEVKPDSKGKGKASGAKLVRDPVSKMTKQQIEAEIKELEEVRGDLKLKMEELASPNDDTSAATTSVPELVARELDSVLNAKPAGIVLPSNAPVNDLTGMVKKKKKAETLDNSNGKRKAEDEGDIAEKKVRLDGES